jgi:hypothetical protein
MRIATMEIGLYRIPLAIVLSDSTHGTITHFELFTVKLHDSVATGAAERLWKSYGPAVERPLPPRSVPVTWGEDRQPSNMINPGHPGRSLEGYNLCGGGPQVTSRHCFSG